VLVEAQALGGERMREWPACGSIAMMAYRILYARPTEQHFAHLSRLQQKALLDAIDLQLRHEPIAQTKNRKRMRPNPLAAWELRVGKLRAYYDVLTIRRPRSSSSPWVSKTVTLFRLVVRW
jgi:hypothetical protein